MKKFLVLGRTASGKSTIVKNAAEKLNMTVLKSYCTRPPRNGESDTDHIFVKPEDVEKYTDDMIAYTDKIDEYERFATLEQFLKSDFYIIDPVGVQYLKSLNIPNVELVEIYIRVPTMELAKRAKKRGDKMTDFDKRFYEENDQFTEYEKEQKFKWHVLNNTTIDDAVNKLCSIVDKEINGTKKGKRRK